MHITITETMFIEQFRIMDRMDNFSLDGLKALFAYFEGLEDDIGEPIECDVIAICCDYQEMTIEEIIDQYSDLIDIEDMKASIANDDIDWIEDRYDYVKEVMEQHTTVIGYNHEDWSGLIIQSF